MRGYRNGMVVLVSVEGGAFSVARGWLEGFDTGIKPRGRVKARMILSACCFP